MKMSDFFEIVKAKICWGWCQKKYKDGDCYCLSGAMWYAAGARKFSDYFVVDCITGDDCSERYLKAAEILQQVLINYGEISEIAVWNDQKYRTKYDVIQVINQAIDYCLRQELYESQYKV